MCNPSNHKLVDFSALLLLYARTQYVSIDASVQITLVIALRENDLRERETGRGEEEWRGGVFKNDDIRWMKWGSHGGGRIGGGGCLDFFYSVSEKFVLLID